MRVAAASITVALRPGVVGVRCRPSPPSRRKTGSTATHLRSPMTWSIVARDACPMARFGVAIASRFFAVGALCVHTRRGVGALVDAGADESAVRAGRPRAAGRGRRRRPRSSRMLTAADDGRDQRQLHVLPARGPRRRAHRQRTASTGAATRLATTSASPATCSPARRWSTRPREAFVAHARPAVGRAPARRDGRRRGRRRRQARQAGRGAAHPRRRGLSGARPARRRPRRADRRAAAPLREEPRALPALRRLPAGPRAIAVGHHRPRARSRRASTRFHARSARARRAA